VEATIVKSALQLWLLTAHCSNSINVLQQQQQQQIARLGSKWRTRATGELDGWLAHSKRKSVSYSIQVCLISLKDRK
jgi:hypothetical protein